MSYAQAAAELKATRTKYDRLSQQLAAEEEYWSWELDDMEEEIERLEEDVIFLRHKEWQKNEDVFTHSSCNR